MNDMAHADAHAKRLPRVYIAGPYTTGDVAQNVRTAILAADWLAHSGCISFCPHLTHFWHLLTPHPFEFWLGQDLAWLRVCDALMRLPGESRGAEMEVVEARSLGMPVFNWPDEGMPVDGWRAWREAWR